MLTGLRYESQNLGGRWFNFHLLLMDVTRREAFAYI